MKNKDKALEIMQNIDPKDAIFISGALGYPNSIIWSNDKHFKKQKEILALNTQEFIKIFKIKLK